MTFITEQHDSEEGEQNIIYTRDIKPQNQMDQQKAISPIAISSFKNIEARWRTLLRPE